MIILGLTHQNILSSAWPKRRSDKILAAVALGRLGGMKGVNARAAKLSAARRSETARNGVLARWRKEK